GWTARNRVELRFTSPYRCDRAAVPTRREPGSTRHGKANECWWWMTMPPHVKCWSALWQRGSFQSLVLQMRPPRSKNFPNHRPEKAAATRSWWLIRRFRGWMALSWLRWPSAVLDRPVNHHDAYLK